MKVQRFFSSTMQDALKAVRDELGADAVILSNEKKDNGVEIVAALDYDEEQAQAAVGVSAKVSPSRVARLHAEKHLRLQDELGKAKRHIAEVRQAKRPQTTVSAPQELPVAAEVPATAQLDQQSLDQLSSMRAEIESLKGLISQKVSAPASDVAPVMTVPQQQTKERLDAMCIVPHVRDALLASVRHEATPESAWGKAASEIEDGIALEYGEIIDHGGVIALVGPTGSGKTMTIGKLAARYVMKFGADSIALVTTDRYRIAAHEQLKVFGRILNVPVHSVDEQHSLDAILDRLSNKKLVLVDTAGLMPNDKSWSQQLREIKMSAHRVQPYLVMPAVGQYQVMCANYHHYRKINPAGLIVTKLDEAVSLGEVISFLMESPLRVAYYTDGQRVPEDIHRLEKNVMREKAEGLLNSSERWVTISTEETEGDENSMFSHSA